MEKTTKNQEKTTDGQPVNRHRIQSPDPNLWRQILTNWWETL